MSDHIEGGARFQITLKEEPDVRSHRRRSQMSDHIEGEARSHRRRSQMSDHIEGGARCKTYQRWYVYLGFIKSL